jgi:hypothetical protein
MITTITKDDPRNPMQPIVKDKDGVTRFKGNICVRKLLTYATERGYGLNEIFLEDITYDHDDYVQLMQLIGYSLSGFGELSCVDDDTYKTAEAMYEKKMDEKEARIQVLEAELKAVRKGLREPIARLYGIHPYNLAEVEE